MKSPLLGRLAFAALMCAAIGRDALAQSQQPTADLLSELIRIEVLPDLDQPDRIHHC